MIENVVGIVQSHNCLFRIIWYNTVNEKTCDSTPIIHETERFVQRQMENGKEFMIRLGSVRDVEDFVRLSTEQPYPVYLDDGNQQVNGKSFMEMFCLNLTRPLRVTVQCGEDQVQDFLSQTARFQI